MFVFYLVVGTVVAILVALWSWREALIEGPNFLGSKLSCWRAGKWPNGIHLVELLMIVVGIALYTLVRSSSAAKGLGWSWPIFCGWIIYILGIAFSVQGFLWNLVNPYMNGWLFARVNGPGFWTALFVRLVGGVVALTFWKFVSMPAMAVAGLTIPIVVMPIILFFATRFMSRTISENDAREILEHHYDPRRVNDLIQAGKRMKAIYPHYS